MNREALSAPVHGAVCCRCHSWTTTPVAVRWIERVSGPGVTLYACPEHAPALGTGSRSHP